MMEGQNYFINVTIIRLLLYVKIRAKKKAPQGEALGDFYHALHMSS